MVIIKKTGEKIDYLITELDGNFESYWKGIDLANYILSKHGDRLKIAFNKLADDTDHEILKITVMKGEEVK